MKLYYSKNTIATAAAIALHEAGVDFTPVNVDFKANEQQSPEYLALNPKGRVPLLITDAGALSETGAILEYIAALSPAAGLMPEDAWEAAEQRSVMYYLATTLHINRAHGMRGYRWAKEQSSFDDMKAKVPENILASCAYLEENYFKTGPYLLGTSRRLADCYFYPMALWLAMDGYDLSAYPKMQAFMAAMAPRASVAFVKSMGCID